MEKNLEVIQITETKSVRTEPKAQFLRGVQAGIPIAIGFIPCAIAFGLLSRSAGIPIYIGGLMSFMVFAGASQFVAVNLIMLSTSFGEIVLTTFILNLRHLLMSASISQRMDENISKKFRALLAFGVTDETFTMATMQKEEKLDPFFILGLNLTAFSAWNIGTWIGILAGSALPETIQASMGITLYVMFIGLLVPSFRKSLPIAVVALTAIVIHSVLMWVPFLPKLSTGWNIIIATVIAAFLGALLFDKGSDKS